jgi:hypothetical protein
MFSTTLSTDVQLQPLMERSGTGLYILVKIHLGHWIPIRSPDSRGWKNILEPEATSLSIFINPDGRL